MRAFILGALATGLLAAAPVAASADTIVEDFTIPVAAGTSNGSFVSDPFPGFDPSLGTLTDVIETLAQSLTWIPGFTVNDASPAVLTVSLHSPISVSQTFTASTSEPQRLTLVLNAEASSIGSGSQKAVLSTRENSGFGRLSRTELEGTMHIRLHPVSFFHRGPALWRRIPSAARGRRSPRTLDLGDDARGLREPWLCVEASEAGARIAFPAHQAA